MDAAGEEWLNARIIKVANMVLGDGEEVEWQQEGDERRAVGHGGFSINTRNGLWYSHSLEKGGRALDLIRHLKGYTWAQARAWSDSFRANAEPAGIAPDITGQDDEPEIDNAVLAQAMLDAAIPLPGTRGEFYFRSRAINDIDCAALPVMWLDDARTGEGALVTPLCEHGRTVAVLVTYINAFAQKSEVKPARRRYNLESPSRGAVLELPAPAGVVDISADTVVAEGVEDGLSVACLDRPWTIKALPGIGALKHLAVKKKGERILVVRDGDPAGSDAGRALVTGIDHLILEGAVVRVTDTPPGEDANAVLQARGPDGLRELLETATAAELSRAGEIIQAARLDTVDYEDARKSLAEKLGLRVSVLDKEVTRQRQRQGLLDADDGEAVGDGRRVIVPTVDPWPEKVDGVALLDALVTGIRQYLVLDPHQVDAIALFAPFTHAFHSFEVAPKLVVNSAQKRSGKTRQMEVLSRLVAKPISVSGINPAPLLRLIEHHAPTLLLDELDALLKGNPELAEALRGIINSGFNRASANIIKAVPIPGGGWEERLFSTWCPQVLAGIGKPPDTVADRSIIIEMKRKLRSEKVRRLRAKDGDDLRVLARKAARWAGDHQIELGAADPDTPKQLDDRAADAWAPLFAIADACSPEWGKRARVAAIQLSGLREEDTLETELLADIRDLFAEKKAEALSSDQLVAGLSLLEGHPWADINRGHPLTKHGLARRLKPFHISPGTIRLGSGTTAKGYKLEQFQDPFARYLVTPLLDTPDQTVTPSQPAENKAKTTKSKPSHGGGRDGLKTSENPSVSAGCDDVTVSNPQNRGGVGKTGDSGSIPAANGHDPAPALIARPRDRLTPRERDILAYVKANPAVSIDQLRKRYGGPKAAIAKLLGWGDPA